MDFWHVIDQRHSVRAFDPEAEVQSTREVVAQAFGSIEHVERQAHGSHGIIDARKWQPEIDEESFFVLARHDAIRLEADLFNDAEELAHS